MISRNYEKRKRKFCEISDDPSPAHLTRDEIRLILLRRRCAPSPACGSLKRGRAGQGVKAHGEGVKAQSKGAKLQARERGSMPFRIVMAGLVPAIHVLANRKKGVDARVKPGHDESAGQLKPRRKFATHVTHCGATGVPSLPNSLQPQRKCAPSP